MKQLTAFLLFVAFSGYAQTITGTVVDQMSSEPIPGATVLVKNSSNGTNADFDGNFMLSNIQPNSILIVSSIGYKTSEVNIKNNTTLTITLEEDIESLSEVVVVGYGTQTKKEITGAVSVVTSETIEAIKPTRIEQALQGQVAGVNITSSSGAPGAGLDIRIRGISTNGNNAPLILVDGNVISELSVINPNDVASVSVLKDASAGIYGTRSANGVILITTKTGRRATPLEFEYNGYVGMQSTTRKIPTLNATEYALLVNEAYAAAGDDLPYPNAHNLGQGTDWQDALFQWAPITSNDLSVRGGGEKSKYSGGISYFTQDGIIGGPKASFKRLNGRLNYNLEVFDFLDIKASMLYSGTERQTLPENAIGSLLYNAGNMPPTLPLYDANGNPSRAIGLPIEVVNPLAQDKASLNETLSDRISGVFGIKLTPFENFTAQANYQWNYTEVLGRYFGPIVDFGEEGISDKIFDNLEQRTFSNPLDIYRDYTFDAYLNYEEIFLEDHTLKLTLGTSVYSAYAEGYGSTGVGMPEITNIDQADVNDANQIIPRFINVSNRFNEERLLSYFGRVQYDYDGKYILSGVIRRDSSSKFGPSNKTAFFPSGSFGWILSEENFLEDSGFFDFVKIRGSWGVLGNDRINSFLYQPLLDGEGVYVFDNQLAYGVAQGAPANPEVKWEEQETFDIGVDLRFWEDTVSLTADYYQRKTKDLLLRVETSGILGVSAPGSGLPIANAGTIQNKGFELELGYEKQFSDNFRLDINYNFSTIENEVLEVNNSVGDVPGGTFGIGNLVGPAQMRAGFPMGYFYGFKTDGIFQNQAEVDAHPSQIGLGANASPGDFRFMDVNQDGEIDQDDRMYLGKPIPDITMGLNLSFDYKNFDFQSYFFASLGFETVRNYDRGHPLTNKTTLVLNRWTGPGTSNTSPRLTTAATTNNLFSDFYVEDGSFLRAQNMQLGYTIDPKHTSFEKVRVYMSVNNAFTLTKYQGYDPTTSTGSPLGGGFDQGFYPNPRTFIMGLNVKF